MQGEIFQSVYLALLEVPYGKVTTYGQLANVIGYPKNSRMVGKAMRYANLYGTYPCYKVLNSKGELLPDWKEQEMLLRQEGIEVHNRKVDLKKYLWPI